MGHSSSAGGRRSGLSVAKLEGFARSSFSILAASLVGRVAFETFAEITQR